MVVPETLTSVRLEEPSVLIPGRFVIPEPSPMNCAAETIPVTCKLLPSMVTPVPILISLLTSKLTAPWNVATPAMTTSSKSA